MLIDWTAPNIGSYGLGFLITWNSAGSVTPPPTGTALEDRTKIGTIYGFQIRSVDPRMGGL